MAAIMFDTYAFVKELTGAGMPEPQAEVLARSQVELIDKKLADKQDLKLVKEDLQRELRELELRLTYNLTIRFGSMMVVAVGIMAALVKML